MSKRTITSSTSDSISSGAPGATTSKYFKKIKTEDNPISPTPIKSTSSPKPTPVKTSSFSVSGSTNPKTLILGTHPSIKSLADGEKDESSLTPLQIHLRGCVAPQPYGNPSNSFWNIHGVALGFSRVRTNLSQKYDAFTENDIALWDVVQIAIHRNANNSLDSDIDVSLSTANDIKSFLELNRSCNRIVFPLNSAQMFIKFNQAWLKNEDDNLTFYINVNHEDEWSKAKTIATFLPSHGKQNKKGESLPRKFKNVYAEPHPEKRAIELVVTMSTSPASASDRPPRKEKNWLQSCYGWDSVKPKDHYVCGVCDALGNHYTHDCDSYNVVWRDERKKKNVEQKKVMVKGLDKGEIIPAEKGGWEEDKAWYFGQ